MSVKAVNGGYVIDFTVNHERYRETVPAPHNKTAKRRIEDQESLYKMAISLNDKSVANRFPNSKIIQKAFDTVDHNILINKDVRERQKAAACSFGNERDTGE